ncbi:MAG: nuclear transport factor 2 family protein [Acidimicrobiales bacterium]
MTGTEPGPRSDGDQEALRRLSIDYADAVDGRDGARLASLFVPDGALVVPDYPRGMAPVVVRAGSGELARIPDGLRRYRQTFHQTSDHKYTVDGDRASGEVLCVAHHVSSGPAGAPGTDTVWFIRYHDEYVRTDAGWRFVRRELHLQFVEQQPVEAVRD